jgi:hypothetical protein
MPLTSAEQSKVVQLLGYGGKVIQAGSVIYDKVMNDRLNSLPPDTESLVRIYLGSVHSIECKIAEAPARLAAAAIDGLRMNLDELSMLRSERKKIAREIAALLDIPYVGTNGVSVGMRN